MSTWRTADLDALAERINGFEFDHVFTLHPDGSITEPKNVWAPSVYHDPYADIYMDGSGWKAITGMTGQDRYHGAVMHPSEYIGRGIAELMLDYAADEPVTFAVVVVSDLEAEDYDDNLVGWAIVYRTNQEEP